jgi:mRNA interferase YafQ
MVKPYLIITSQEFDADMKRLEAQGSDLTLLKKIMNMLANRIDIPDKYSDHQLKRRLKVYRDIHIDDVDDVDDWIVIYRYIGHSKIRFERTGSHADIFGKKSKEK